jgi:hypothetical protein
VQGEGGTTIIGSISGVSPTATASANISASKNIVMLCPVESIGAEIAARCDPEKPRRRRSEHFLEL